VALNLFGRLMPREESFTRLFCAQTDSIVAAATELRRMIDQDGSLDAYVMRVRQIETEADATARQIFLAANRTFNAPIDREDIIELARVLDDVVDLIEDTAKLIQRYLVREFTQEMRAMVDAVLHSAQALQKAIPLLDAITREHQAILAECERIGRIEGEADDCFDGGLTRLRAQLRAGELDTITYLDRKEVYERLEDVVDKCDDVANALETITAKHV
jgi:predicted phosphate transport protein (TIGR00153 family)